MSSRIRIAVCFWALVAAACTTEESGIPNVGGQGGVVAPSGVGGSTDGPMADAPISNGDGGRCNPALDKALGASCNCGDECGSGFCADGVCCNTQCTGACVACNQPSTLGQCSAVRSG